MANKGHIKCSFGECYEYFSNEKKLRKHKKEEHKEFYCHICDESFDEWETAIAHKSQKSGTDIFGKTQKDYAREKADGTFWNNREIKGPTYGELKFHKYHCKFCGMDYNTNSAREQHTVQQHPIDQNIECPGCGSTFPKAAGLVYHLEEGHCHKISSVEFKGYLQHKGLILRLLDDPTLLAKVTEKDINGYYESARDDSKTGGVSLLDLPADEDITWDEDEDILEPERPAVPAMIPAGKMNFPSLPIHQRIANQSNGITTAMSNLKVEDDNKPSAWGATSTSKKLFPNAKVTEPTDEWKERHQALQKEDKKSNILTYQFWNPASPDYDPNRFYDPIIEKHRCPFPTCEQYFDAPVDCQKHITEMHAITKIRCPSCLKLFRAFHALIAHVESSQKCKIKYSNRFGQALEEFSGGFLTSQVVPHPDLAKDKDNYQVHFIQYSSAVPAGWEERKDGTTIGTDLKRI